MFIGLKSGKSGVAPFCWNFPLNVGIPCKQIVQCNKTALVLVSPQFSSAELLNCKIRYLWTKNVAFVCREFCKANMQKTVGLG